MVRQVTKKRTALWKPLAAITIAAGALLWHLLACVESPMAFSPSGDLAFVTMEPYDGDDLPIAGTHAFRLMTVSNLTIRSKEKPLRILEESTSHMLTAPAWSPDGKFLAYLRIPLLTPEELQKINDRVKERVSARDAATSRPAEAERIWRLKPSPATGEPATRPAGKHDELSLPSLQAQFEFFHDVQLTPMLPAELVVRDVSTGQMTSVVALEAPFAAQDFAKKGVEQNLLLTYLLTRPQYDPEGKWIYFRLQDILMAVNPATGDQRILGTALASCLSPDGRHIAAVMKKAIGFIRTDGGKATYIRWEEKISPSGLAWVDNKTLAILREPDKDKVVIDFLSIDGSILRSQEVALAGQGEKSQAGELAVAPDGKHLAMSFGENAYILRPDGKVVKAWHLEEADALVQPTFAPDSKSIAFKYMDKNENRASAIVLFSLDGKEVARIGIPKIKAGTTRPASQPATQPETLPED